MLLAEVTFANTVATAEGVRQVAKAAALATYGWNASGLATYTAALVAADLAYDTAISNAQSASGLVLGNAGTTGPYPNRVASIIGIG